MASIPERLIDEIHQRQCVVFLGSDLPLGFEQGKAPPCRKELAQFLIRKVGTDTDLPLPNVAEDFEAKFGRFGLVNEIKCLVDNPVYKPQRLHNLVASLPVNAIITTNYDKLLEESLRKNKKTTQVVIQDIDVPFIEEDRTILLKLYGCITQPDSLIITQEDCIQIERRLRTIMDVARYLFLLKPMLFLGFPLNDITFRKLFEEATYDLGSFRRRTYAVWEKAPQSKIAFWSGRNLEVIDREPVDFLKELLSILKELEPLPIQTRPLISIENKDPYKYLDAYGLQDADIFFGRATDTLLLWRQILTYRITLLFGASGTGKTSLIQAGVRPKLHRVGYKTAMIRMIDDNPIMSTIQAVYRTLNYSGDLSRSISIFDSLQKCLTRDDRLVLFFDQFEEFFIRHNKKTQSAFIEQIVSCISDPDHEVRFVFSMREDYLAKMEAFQVDIPNLWANIKRLMPLGHNEAKAAIQEPARRHGMAYEPRLVDRILEDLSEDDKISPPNLQIVCTQLYEKTRWKNPSEVQETLVQWKEIYPTLSIAGDIKQVVVARFYEELGSVRGILQDYLKESIRELVNKRTEKEEGIQDILKSLVTRHSTKAVLSIQQITEHTGLELSQVQSILEGLAELRLVRPLEDGHRYELMHEYLIVEIQNWITPEEAKARVVKAFLEQGLERHHHPDFGHLLVLDIETLKIVNEERDNPKLRLTSEEYEYILRSSLIHGYEISFWLGRIPTGDRAVSLALEILLNGSKSVQIQARSGLRELNDNPSKRSKQLINGLWEHYQSNDKLRHPAALALWKVRNQLPPNTRLQIIPLVIKEELPGLVIHFWPVLLLLTILFSVSVWWIGHKLTPKPTIEWVLVEAGEFEMGSEEGAEDEKPVHQVYLDSFEIAKYEVSNSAYSRCVKAFACQKPDSEVFELEEFAEHPVVNVSWQDANDFCQWVGGRLPTEAEWEKAASWNSINQRKYKWPWGDDWNPTKLVSQEGSERDTVAVDDPKYEVGKSPYGLIHMAGNVWEWTTSFYDNYPYIEKGVEDLIDVSQYRVVRGGSWGDVGEVARTTDRNRLYPDTHDNDLGFRCLRDID